MAEKNILERSTKLNGMHAHRRICLWYNGCPIRKKALPYYGYPSIKDFGMLAISNHETIHIASLRLIGTQTCEDTHGLYFYPLNLGNRRLSASKKDIPILLNDYENRNRC